MKVRMEVPNILDREERLSQISQRLKFLELFNNKFKGMSAPFPIENIKQILKHGEACYTKKQKEADEIFYKLNDYDLCEVMAISLLEKNDRSFSLFNDLCKNKYLPWLMNESHEKKLLFLEQQASIFKGYCYPRLRARLVYQELLFACTRKDKFLFNLIQLSPQYLRSQYISDKIEYIRVGKITDDNFIKSLAKAVSTKADYRKRKLNYWDIDSRQRSIVNFIKKYSQMLKKEPTDANDFIEYIFSKYEVGKDLAGRIKEAPEKYLQHSVDYLMELNLIPEKTTLTHTIQPHLKKIRENILYTDLDDFSGPFIYALLDFSRINPELASKHIQWKEIEVVNLNT